RAARWARRRCRTLSGASGLGPEAKIDGEAPVLEGAIDLPEAGRTHPVELGVERRASVVAHSLDRALVLAPVNAGGQNRLVPQPAVARLGHGRRAAHLVGVDEQAPRLQSVEDAREQPALGVV